jgi:hypothetical protein
MLEMVSQPCQKFSLQSGTKIHHVGSWDHQVDEEATLALTAKAIRKAADAEPIAVICGGETGVKAGEKNTRCMGKIRPHL